MCRCSADFLVGVIQFTILIPLLKKKEKYVHVRLFWLEIFYYTNKKLADLIILSNILMFICIIIGESVLEYKELKVFSYIYM